MGRSATVGPRPLVKFGAILVPNMAQNTGFSTFSRFISLLESSTVRSKNTFTRWKSKIHVWGLKNHPLWRLIVALTSKEIENASPCPKKYKMADGGGLCLLVPPSGAKLWVRRRCFNWRVRRFIKGAHVRKTDRSLHTREQSTRLRGLGWVYWRAMWKVW